MGDIITWAPREFPASSAPALDFLSASAWGGPPPSVASTRRESKEETLVYPRRPETVKAPPIK